MFAPIPRIKYDSRWLCSLRFASVRLIQQKSYFSANVHAPIAHHGCSANQVTPAIRPFTLMLDNERKNSMMKANNYVIGFVVVLSLMAVVVFTSTYATSSYLKIDSNGEIKTNSEMQIHWLPLTALLRNFDQLDFLKRGFVNLKVNDKGLD